ncbi:MAG: hypothetical protein Q9220_003795 [cf. Caloplaca sp. 1 TL-2023]
MLTLLQLNRHLDDNHKNLEEVKQDEVKDWFKSQMVKAKRFQPLAVLNQKFKSLDVFESNDVPRSPNLVPSSTPQERTPPDPDELRRKRVDKTLLEVSRLEKRLTKLTQLLTNPPAEQPTSPSSILWSFSNGKNQRKQLEQSVVTWEEDSSLLRCPFCQQEFSNYTFRRHHCRLCGRVVCGDPITDCSSEVGLNVTRNTNYATEKVNGEMGVDVRMCKECKHTVFSKHDLAASIAHKPPDVRAYENLVQFEKGIRLMLPKFQRLLQALQDPDKPPSPQILAEASRVRKRLTDSFGQYNTAARRIRDLPTESSTQQKLQKAIFQQAGNFLHVHMLPLKALPKIMKHATPSDRLIPNGRPNGALASIKLNDIDTASQASSSSAISALEVEEKALRERLIVLEEQSFLVKEQIADASKRRKFDEVSSLSQNVEDLEREINQVQGQLAQLDSSFAGVYSGSGMQSPAAR